MRIARSTVEGRLGEQEDMSSEPKRTVLTSLRVKGQKNHVPHERVGANAVGVAGRVSQSTSARNAHGPTFQIFQVGALGTFALQSVINQ